MRELIPETKKERNILGSKTDRYIGHEAKLKSNKIMETNQNIIYTIADDATIVLNTQNNLLIIPVEKIAFCKADGSYSKVLLENGKEIIVSKSLIVIERSLTGFNFIRCHNSYLVNARKVEKFDRKMKTLTVFGHTIPVSRRKCCQTMMKMKTLNDQI